MNCCQINDVVYVFSILACIFISSTMSLSIAATSERVVIIGAGIHGCSIAYYLTEKGHKPIVIERSEVASAASGKSGGFLAREWGSGPTTALHQKSFDMHERLANELHVESYRRLPAISVSENRIKRNAASWLDGYSSTSNLDGGCWKLNE